MARKDESLNLTAREVTTAFADGAWATAFPPILNCDQAAALLQVPKQTIYDWSSRGLLRGCSRRIGKHLRFVRDRLIAKIFNEGLYADRP
jgi:hypothetical protein